MFKKKTEISAHDREAEAREQAKIREENDRATYREAQAVVLRAIAHRGAYWPGES